MSIRIKSGKHKNKLTDAEAYELSTPEERQAVNQYRGIQKRAEENGGYWGETDMLIASQAVSIIVRRNKRLGLIK